jgi:hypothetical protein
VTVIENSEKALQLWHQMNAKGILAELCKYQEKEMKLHKILNMSLDEAIDAALEGRLALQPLTILSLSCLDCPHLLNKLEGDTNHGR